MAGEDETTVSRRLDREIPALGGYVILRLGDRPLRRATAQAIALAHRELRAVGGRLVVVTNPEGARQCARVCPDVFVAATERQAHAALGLSALNAA
jgi:hypothetical protein